MFQQQYSALVIEDCHSCRYRKALLSNPGETVSHPRWKMAPDCAEKLLQHKTGSITWLPGGNSRTRIHTTELPTAPSVYKKMTHAFETHWEYVLLAAVVAFIVLCTIVSLILKELYRRQ